MTDDDPAVRVVERHPEWFFRSGQFDVHELIGLLVQEVARGGAVAIDVRWTDGWVSVAADVDWLEGDLDPFLVPTSYPEGGQNSTRVEVALTAFCKAVFTVAGPHQVLVQERGFIADIEDVPHFDNADGRTVAFTGFAVAEEEEGS